MPEPPRVLAATGLEAWALRRALKEVDVARTGMKLRRWHEPAGHQTALVGGLAGALSADLQPGSVVVPAEVGLPDGTRLPCDRDWSARLASAAVELGFVVERGPLLTADSIVTGPARGQWRRLGYVAADMEAGFLMVQGWRVAVVRVILDTPARSIAEEWERPSKALLLPHRWGELMWLTYSAPRYALRAARIVKHALTEITSPWP